MEFLGDADQVVFLDGNGQATVTTNGTATQAVVTQKINSGEFTPDLDDFLYNDDDDDMSFLAEFTGVEEPRPVHYPQPKMDICINNYLFYFRSIPPYLLVLYVLAELFVTASEFMPCKCNAFMSLISFFWLIQ